MTCLGQTSTSVCFRRFQHPRLALGKIMTPSNGSGIRRANCLRVFVFVSLSSMFNETNTTQASHSPLRRYNLNLSIDVFIVLCAFSGAAFFDQTRWDFDGSARTISLGRDELYDLVRSRSQMHEIPHGNS